VSPHPEIGVEPQQRTGVGGGRSKREVGPREKIRRSKISKDGSLGVTVSTKAPTRAGYVNQKEEQKRGRQNIMGRELPVQPPRWARKTMGQEKHTSLNWGKRN